MRVVADAHRLPLAPASVDLVVGNPPYPGNGVWSGSWPQGIDAAMTECRRVMRPGGTGWFLLPHHGEDRWLYFDHVDARWGHVGSWSWPTPDSGVTWGVIPDVEVAPLILQWSQPGDVVLDPFAGRGGVPRLAARLGRVPVGVDIDADQLENGGPYAQENARRPRPSGQEEGADGRTARRLRLRNDAEAQEEGWQVDG